jgi:hypothetical protein
MIGSTSVVVKWICKRIFLHREKFTHNGYESQGNGLWGGVVRFGNLAPTLSAVGEERGNQAVEKEEFSIELLKQWWRGMTM